MRAREMPVIFSSEIRCRIGMRLHADTAARVTPNDRAKAAMEPKWAIRSAMSDLSIFMSRFIAEKEKTVNFLLDALFAGF